MNTVEFKSEAARAAIRKAQAALADPTPMFQEIAELVQRSTLARFRAQVAPDGSKWAPKAQSTIDRYKQQGYGGAALSRALFREGDLSRNVISQATRSGAVIGSALIYSGVMQDGADKGAFGTNARGRPIPWGRIPARTWLGLSTADDAAIVEIAEEYLAGPLGGADR